MIIMFTMADWATDSTINTWQQDATGNMVQITPANLQPSIHNYQASAYYPNKAVAFAKASVIAMLGQDNCVGMRCYFAESVDSGGNTYLDLVLVGVELGTSGTLTDMITITNPDGTTVDALICDCSMPCPPTCDTTSPFYA